MTKSPIFLQPRLVCSRCLRGQQQAGAGPDSDGRSRLKRTSERRLGARQHLPRHSGLSQVPWSGSTSSQQRKQSQAGQAEEESPASDTLSASRDGSSTLLPVIHPGRLNIFALAWSIVTGIWGRNQQMEDLSLSLSHK